MKKLLFLIVICPLICFSQTKNSHDNNYNEGTIFNLNIGDYASTVKSIKKIDSLILITKNLLIKDAKNKAEDLESQSYFETDESYISRIYDDIYNDFSYFNPETNTSITRSKVSEYLEKIEMLNSKKISLRNNVFISKDINLKFVDSLYDANTGKWLVEGSHNISELINQSTSSKLIMPFELDLPPETAKYFFNNLKDLIFEGVYCIKYVKIELIAIRISAPNIVVDYRFPEFDSLIIKYPMSYSSKLSYYPYRGGVDSVFKKVFSPEPIKIIEFSNSDKFLAFGGENSFFIYSLETGVIDTLLYHTEVSVGVVHPNSHPINGGELSHTTHYRSYHENNVNEWNIDRDILGHNGKIKGLVFGIEEIEFSPNDSILILSLSTTYPSYSKDPSTSQLLIYNLYSKEFSNLGPTLTVFGENIGIDRIDNPFRNITFPYIDNNTFYCLVNVSNIYKIDISSNKIEDYFIHYNDIPISVWDFKLSYDEQFFLINDTLMYNNRKELLLYDYKIPAAYYNLFNDYSLGYIFSLPFGNDDKKNFDIRCPSCGNNYLKLYGNNVFKCNDGYYSCRKSYVIIEDEFIALDYKTTLSKNNKDLIANITTINHNSEGDFIHITHTISQACKYTSGYLDKCGNCVGGRSGKIPCIKDCNGDYGGSAYIDDCKVCVSGNTGIIPNFDKDSCDVCFGDNSTCTDCNNVLFGSSFFRQLWKLCRG